MGRSLLKRLESPVDFYEKRIINNMQNLRKEIQTGDVLLVEGRSKISRIIQRINEPYGSKLIMRHFSQIIPRDFDLSPNFEIVKFNIIGSGGFDYQNIWADKY